MNSRIHDLLYMPAVAWLAGVLAAQQPATVPANAPGLGSLGRGHGLRQDGDQLVGLGADYVVRFDRSGMRFLPVLGREAEPCPPLQLSLTGIRRGAEGLSCALTAAPVQADATAIYPRSPTIRERYELRDDGVEQSFVFDALPGRGDLVVRCALHGLGAHAVPAAGGGLAFVRAGRQLARMGSVIGIDARGRRVAGKLTLLDQAVELSLPADFVDQAALPLVLDPFVQTGVAAGPGSTFDIQPDVAYDPIQQHWVFVWERNVSQVQSDIVRRTWSPTTGLGTLTSMASASGQYNQAPKIAFHTGINRFLVVFQQQAWLLGPATVVGMTLDGNGAQGAQVALGLPAAGSNLDPDVSGDPTGSGRGIVCYKIDGPGQGIRYRSYTLAATGDPVQGPQVTVTTQASAVRPRVSKSAGATLALVFEQRPQTSSGVFIQAISRAGALLGATAGVLNLAGPDLHRPEVDGDGTRFLMALEYQRGLGDRDVSVAEWVWNGSAFGPPASSAAVSGLVGIDESAPTVALLGQKYAVAWEHQTGFLTGTVRCRTFATGGCVPCGPELPVTAAGNHVQPALASDVASGGAGVSAMLACALAGSTLPMTADVVGFRWDTHAGSSPVTQGAGCGHPTTLQPTGAPGLGNSAFGFQAQTADPQAALAIFSLAFGFSAPLGSCGSCLLVSPSSAELRPVVGGTAGYVLPIPCDMAFLGLPLRAQAVMFGSTQNVCPAAAQLSASPTLGITIGD